MTIEVNQWYLEDAVSPWFYLSHARWAPEGYNFDPQDTECIAGLVVKDLVPWIREWPRLLQNRLRDALEYTLQHGEDGVLNHSNWDGQTWLQIDHPREAVWEPMFAELFGERKARPKEAYQLLRGNDQDAAMHADLGDYRFVDHMPDWLPPDL